MSRDAKWSPWGSAWSGEYYMARPDDVAMAMRDGLGLTIQQICVLEVLVSFRDPSEPGSFVVWATYETIADRAGMSMDAVGRAIRPLLKEEIVVEDEEAARGHARRYDLKPFIDHLSALRPAATKKRTKE